MAGVVPTSVKGGDAPKFILAYLDISFPLFKEGFSRNSDLTEGVY